MNQYKDLLHKYILSCMITIALSISLFAAFSFFYFVSPANPVYLAVFDISILQAATITVPSVFLIGLPSAIFIKKIEFSIKWHSKLAQYLVESFLFLIISFVGTIIILVILYGRLNVTHLMHDKIYFIYGFLCALIFQASLNTMTAIDIKQKEILSLMEGERD